MRNCGLFVNFPRSCRRLVSHCIVPSCAWRLFNLCLIQMSCLIECSATTSCDLIRSHYFLATLRPGCRKSFVQVSTCVVDILFCALISETVFLLLFFLRARMCLTHRMIKFCLFLFQTNLHSVCIGLPTQTDGQNTILEEEYRIIVIFPKLSTVSW